MRAMPSREKPACSGWVAGPSAAKTVRRDGKKRDGRNRGIADTKRGKHARLLP